MFSVRNVTKFVTRKKEERIRNRRKREKTDSVEEKKSYKREREREKRWMTYDGSRVFIPSGPERRL